jgi:cellulose synthase operon protein C
LASDAAFMEAESLFQQKKYAEAVDAYAGIKKFFTLDYAALACLHSAQAMGQLQQWEKCISLLTGADKKFPQSEYLPEMLCELGLAKQNAGKPAEAVTLYEQVIAKTDRELAARAQFLIGEIQFQQKKYAEAVKSYTKVIYGYSYPQWSSEAAYECGRCFEALQKPADAIKLFGELIEKFPQSEKAEAAKKRLEELKK